MGRKGSEMVDPEIISKGGHDARFDAIITGCALCRSTKTCSQLGFMSDSLCCSWILWKCLKEYD